MPSQPEPVLETMREEDWPRVREIYVSGIFTGNATFETTVPEWEQWDQGHLAAPRLVVRVDEEIAGWAALSPVSARAAYRGVAEVSVYVAPEWRARGIGRLLLGALIRESEAEGIWTLQAGIFPENEASVRLHDHFGFRLVGHRERIGKLAGRWRDVLLFERRSGVAG